MVVFDVMTDGIYLNHETIKRFCQYNTLEFVPTVYINEFVMEYIKPHMEMKSYLYDGIREGIVIKPIREEQTYMGRKILKWKSDKFLLKAEDDTH
jgi:hypothetical protein